MTILERYELILKQGLDEIGPVDFPADRQQALALQGELAPQLGDVLFRLTVEHGIPYQPFRETVIGILADQEPALVGASAAPRRFAATLEKVHPLILLALEMMPSEGADL